MTGTKIVSLVVKDPAAGDRQIQFDTRAGAFAPKLVVVTDEATAVSGIDAAVPAGYRLYHSYPNPFNPATTIGFDLPAASDVSLHIYDVLGKQVAVLADGRMDKGTYHVLWDASQCASAVYLVRLTAGGAVFSEKILLAK